MLSNGTIKALGYGYLGDGGGLFTAIIPIIVTGINTATEVSNGLSYFNCAVFSAGIVKCWGQGAYGKLDNGYALNHPTLVTVVDFG